MHAQEDVGSLLILHGGVRWWHLTHDNLSKYMYFEKLFEHLQEQIAFANNIIIFLGNYNIIKTMIIIGLMRFIQCKNRVDNFFVKEILI